MNRLDNDLVYKGYAKSRTRAQRYIKKGYVTVNGSVVSKVSLSVSDTDVISLLQTDEYVSRGAYKLLQAFSEFNLNVDNMVCMDIGASTGGFTQVLVEKGAKKVYAIDVGTNQLNESLKTNSKVISMENRDIRRVDKSDFSEPLQFFTCDLSFISIEKVATNIFNIMEYESEGVFLVKPQFEAGRENIGKRGIVKNSDIRKKAVDKVTESLIQSGFRIIGSAQCDFPGTGGNVEFLVHVKKKDD